MNTLYFSRRCNYCKEFILSIKNLGLVKQFKYICVDGNRNLPNFVKTVPTIIIEDYADPLSGDYAFKWIDYKKTQRMEQEIQNEQNMNLDGVYAGSSLSYNDINSTSNVADDNNLGDFSALDSVGQTLIDPRLQNDPRFSDSGSLQKRLQELKADRGM
jgi:hypothetical protein